MPDHRTRCGVPDERACAVSIASQTLAAVAAVIYYDFIAVTCLDVQHDTTQHNADVLSDSSSLNVQTKTLLFHDYEDDDDSDLLQGRNYRSVSDVNSRPPAFLK